MERPGRMSRTERTGTDRSDASGASGAAPAAIAPRHHLPDEVLLDYAGGAISGPVATLVASHLALCPRCRGELAALEAMGGAELAGLEPAPLEPAHLSSLLTRLDEAEPPAPLRPVVTDAVECDLPLPLRRALGRPLDGLAWKPFLPGLRQARVQAGGGDVARLLAIRPGAAFPRHTHRGQELTLVLRGAYSDECGRFAAGDVAVADERVRHRPKAEPGEDCLCLLVGEAPVRFTGPFTRWLNPLVPF